MSFVIKIIQENNCNNTNKDKGEQFSTMAHIFRDKISVYRIQGLFTFIKSKNIFISSRQWRILTNILRYLAHTRPTAPLNPGPQTTSTVPLDLVS